MSLKTSDGQYYAAVSDKNRPRSCRSGTFRIRAVPVKQPDITGRSFYLWAKDSTGSRLGIIEYSGGLSIFTSDDVHPHRHADHPFGSRWRRHIQNGHQRRHQLLRLWCVRLAVLSSTSSRPRATPTWRSAIPTQRLRRSAGHALWRRISRDLWRSSRRYPATSAHRTSASTKWDPEH